MQPHYSITSLRPESHQFDVQLDFSLNELEQQQLRLPNWIPGSYMIRDFAKNIVEISAFCNGEALQIKQIDKSTWELEDRVFNDHAWAISIKYTVYAWDLSVRTAHLDLTHGFFNGTSVFLELVGFAEQACVLSIQQPPHPACEQWAVATSLSKHHVDEPGFGIYHAENYDDLIDHPVELGTFKRLTFEACGVPHDIVLTGQFECDEQRLVDDLKVICEHHINFFGQPAPVSYYTFLVMVVGDGYGGLEHRASTSLLVSRKNLPQMGQLEVSEDYRNFLGLCSHEYFHTWNVKRMTPKVFLQSSLHQEVYTPLLWAFEGITSYYDDLALVRTGLINTESYFELLAQTMTRVLKSKGRFKQTIAESSFNAWTKFYKQDENAQNAIVSYYLKGTLVALCLDLTIREQSQGEKSLDDVMRLLWKDYLNGIVGFDDDTIQLKVEAVLQQPCDELFAKLLHSVEELPLKELLETVDVKLSLSAQATQSDKGGKLIAQPAQSDFGAFLQQKGEFLNLVRVDEQGAAQRAGLSAGDDIVAINQLKTSLKQLESMLLLKRPNETLKVSAFRRDELMDFEVLLQTPEENNVLLTYLDDFDKAWPYALN